MAVVMAILVIIAAITYPRIAGYMEMNREMQRSNHEYMVNKALMQYYALTGGYYKAPYNTGDTIPDGDAGEMVSRLCEDNRRAGRRNGQICLHKDGRAGCWKSARYRQVHHQGGKGRAPIMTERNMTQAEASEYSIGWRLPDTPR